MSDKVSPRMKKVITEILVDPSTCNGYNNGLCKFYVREKYGRPISCGEIAECEVYHTAP